MTLHTLPGCNTSTGKSCQYGDGCAIGTNSQTGSYGSLFNELNGGVFAMEWTSSSIKIWFFPRNSTMLSSVLSDDPEPSTSGVSRP